MMLWHITAGTAVLMAMFLGAAHIFLPRAWFLAWLCVMLVLMIVAWIWSMRDAR